MNPTLDWREGYLCVRDEFRMSEEPIIVAHFWPLMAGDRKTFEGWGYVMGEPLTGDGPFFYGASGERFEVHGAAKSVCVERIDVPKP